MFIKPNSFLLLFDDIILRGSIHKRSLATTVASIAYSRRCQWSLIVNCRLCSVPVSVARFTIVYVLYAAVWAPPQQADAFISHVDIELNRVVATIVGTLPKDDWLQTHVCLTIA
jgi:hypothetical protein